MRARVRSGEIKGRIFSAALGIAMTPPRKMTAKATARVDTVSHYGMPKAPLKASDMEFA